MICICSLIVVVVEIGNVANHDYPSFYHYSSYVWFAGKELKKIGWKILIVFLQNC